MAMIQYPPKWGAYKFHFRCESSHQGGVVSARKLSAAVLLGVWLIAFGALAWAQGNRGSITGTVMDTTGAVVPSVSITATDINRGVKYPVISTTAGVYAIPGLEIGQ